MNRPIAAHPKASAEPDKLRRTADQRWETVDQLADRYFSGEAMSTAERLDLRNRILVLLFRLYENSGLCDYVARLIIPREKSGKIIFESYDPSRKTENGDPVKFSGYIRFMLKKLRAEEYRRSGRGNVPIDDVIEKARNDSGMSVRDDYEGCDSDPAEAEKPIPEPKDGIPEPDGDSPAEPAPKNRGPKYAVIGNPTLSEDDGTTLIDTIPSPDGSAEDAVMEPLVWNDTILTLASLIVRMPELLHTQKGSNVPIYYRMFYTDYASFSIRDTQLELTHESEVFDAMLKPFLDYIYCEKCDSVDGIRGAHIKPYSLLYSGGRQETAKQPLTGAVYAAYLERTHGIGITNQSINEHLNRYRKYIDDNSSLCENR